MNYPLVGLPPECKSPSKRREVATFNAGEEQPDDVRKTTVADDAVDDNGQVDNGMSRGEPRREKRRQEIKRLQTRSTRQRVFVPRTWGISVIESGAFQ